MITNVMYTDMYIDTSRTLWNMTYVLCYKVNTGNCVRNADDEPISDSVDVSWPMRRKRVSERIIVMCYKSQRRVIPSSIVSGRDTFYVASSLITCESTIARSFHTKKGMKYFRLHEITGIFDPRNICARNKIYFFY